MGCGSSSSAAGAGSKPEDGESPASPSRKPSSFRSPGSMKAVINVSFKDTEGLAAAGLQGMGTKVQDSPQADAWAAPLVKDGPDPSRPPNHLSQYAVSLNWLLETFLVEFPEVQQKELSTEQVVHHIIIPASSPTARFVEKRKAQGEKGIGSKGRPFFFVTHAWSLPLMDTLRMLSQHFSLEQQQVWRRGQPPIPWSKVFIWLDIFAVNQHPCSSPAATLLGEVHEVLSDSVQNLMVLDRTGAVLSRLWCLFEAWQGGRSCQSKLFVMTYGTELEALKKALSSLDITKAKTSRPEETQLILGEVQHLGVTAADMNLDLVDLLVESVLQEVPPEASGWDVQISSKLYKAALTCRLCGKLALAVPLYRRDMEGSERVLGPDHASSLASVNNLAAVLQDQGKLGEAEPLYRHAVSASEKQLGAQHPDSIVYLGNLAALKYKKDELMESEELFSTALQNARTHLGPEHTITQRMTAKMGVVRDAIRMKSGLNAKPRTGWSETGRPPAAAF